MARKVEQGRFGARVQLNIKMPAEVAEQLEAAALERQMSMNAWVLNAVRSQLGREARYQEKQVGRQSVLRPTYPSGWPKHAPCFLSDCGRLHDPAEHADVTSVELQWELGRLTK